jgi:hypothetical protein
MTMRIARRAQLQWHCGPASSNSRAMKTVDDVHVMHFIPVFTGAIRVNKVSFSIGSSSQAPADRAAYSSGFVFIQAGVQGRREPTCSEGRFIDGRA